MHRGGARVAIRARSFALSDDECVSVDDGAEVMLQALSTDHASPSETPPQENAGPSRGNPPNGVRRDKTHDGPSTDGDTTDGAVRSLGAAGRALRVRRGVVSMLGTCRSVLSRYH